MASITGASLLLQQPISRLCANCGMSQFAFRSLANLFTVLGYSLKGIMATHSWAAWACAVCQFVGEGRYPLNKALAIDDAVAAGMGTGEFAAQLANARAFAVVVFPIVYSKIFDLG